MLRLVLTSIAVAVGLWLLHRFALILEDAGYLYYRKQPEGGNKGMRNVMNQMDYLVRPSVELTREAEEQVASPATANESAASLARAFARALDVGDYEAAGALLSPSCVYAFRDQQMYGREVVIDSYRKNDVWAKQSFDVVEYTSRIVTSDKYTATIEFTDDLCHGEKTLTHSCRQVVEFDDRGLIMRIAHIDLPGEREKVAAFLATCGVTRPSDPGGDPGGRGTEG